MKLKKWEWAVLSGLVIVIIIAGVIIFGMLKEYSLGSSFYDGLEEYVFLPDEVTQPATKGDKKEPEVNENAEQLVYYSDAPTVDFQALKAQNEDVVGWIYGAGTAINYPVVQGETNEEYLYRMVDGTENKCGSIFLDSLNERDFTNQNNIVHGHHMKNGTMFADLVKYKEQAYYDTHPEFWLVTPEKNYRIQLFAGFVTMAESDVWQLTFATEEEFEKWKGAMKLRSCFESSVVAKPGERILTMSTCSYEQNDARFVLMGVMRE